MKALVTGAGGFLGFEIARQLLAGGHCVRGFSRKRYAQLEELGAESAQGDIRDQAAVRHAVEGVDVVFHAAAVAGIWGPWNHYYSINTQGTHNVLDACRAERVRKLVFSSSPSVTFDGGHQEGVDETVPYAQQWLCHYPHSKALAEQAVLAANGKQGMATCALRPHLIWGPRDPHLIPRLIDRARRGRLRQIGDGTNRIDMVFIENAAQAHLQAATHLEEGSAVCGKAYFISQGEPVNCWDWINEILALAGLSPLTNRISLRAAWRVGAVMEGIYRVLPLRGEPPMTRFLAAQLATSHYFDIGAARRDFGYVPSVPSQEGMRRLAQWLAGPDN